VAEIMQQFTREDFLNSTGPYEAVYKLKDNAFECERAKTFYSEMAQKVAGIRNFKTLYNNYVKEQRKVAKQVYTSNTTNFSGQEIELATGDWVADDNGIYGYSKGEE
jgi:hypothetical protein